MNAGIVSASLIINEQTSVLNPTNGQIAVSALHLTVTALGATLLDLRLLNAEADITCSGTVPVCRAIDWFTANQGVISTAGHPGTFAFALGTVNGNPQGNLTYQDFVSNVLIKATSITAVNVLTASSRQISGLATVNGVPGQPFNLQIFDNGAGPTDSLNITVAGYNGNGLLTHGNIEHTVNPCFTGTDG
ncbi:Hypothetical protein A7982_00233 [Minicystis rosea]|nr:Hypothetical protein A7982_00233 [Minicystis rosea]